MGDTTTRMTTAKVAAEFRFGGWGYDFLMGEVSKFTKTVC